MFIFGHFIKIERSCNFFVAAFIVLFYLIMPATIFANSLSIEASRPSAQALNDSVDTTPCDDCPCSDGGSSECCDTTFCNCVCHAPLSPGIRFIYAPVVVSQVFTESSWSLPFFLSHRRIWLRIQDGIVTVGGNASKNQGAFQRWFESLVERLKTDIT